MKPDILTLELARHTRDLCDKLLLGGLRFTGCCLVRSNYRNASLGRTWKASSTCLRRQEEQGWSSTELSFAGQRDFGRFSIVTVGGTERGFDVTHTSGGLTDLRRAPTDISVLHKTEAAGRSVRRPRTWHVTNESRVTGSLASVVLDDRQLRHITYSAAHTESATHQHSTRTRPSILRRVPVYCLSRDASEAGLTTPLMISCCLASIEPSVTSSVKTNCCK
jgi:hypothetical protein